MWRNLCNSKEIFSAHKNLGMNLIAVPEERGDFSEGNLLSHTTFISFTTSRIPGSTSYLHQSSKYSSGALGRNSYLLEAMGMWQLWPRQHYNAWIGSASRGRGTGFQADLHLEPPHLTPSSPLHHSFQHLHRQSLSAGKENQKVRALICTNHNVHDLKCTAHLGTPITDHPTSLWKQ